MAEKIDVKDKIEKGAVLTRAIFEVFGKPKENVDNAIKLIVLKLKELKSIKVLAEKYFEPKKTDELWSNFVELEILTQDLAAFFELVVDFLPSSVEILEPEKVSMNSTDMAGVFNDLSVKLINMNVEYQKTSLERDLLKKKLNTLISINILRAIKEKGMNITDISNELRIEEEDLKPFLIDLEKSGRIEEKDNLYSIKKG